MKLFDFISIKYWENTSKNNHTMEIKQEKLHESKSGKNSKLLISIQFFGPFSYWKSKSKSFLEKNVTSYYILISLSFFEKCGHNQTKSSISELHITKNYFLLMDKIVLIQQQTGFISLLKWAANKEMLIRNSDVQIEFHNS